MLDADLIKMRVDVIGINSSQLSGLAGIPPAKLSQFLAGTRGLRNQEITRLRDALSDLEQLVEIARP